MRLARMRVVPLALVAVLSGCTSFGDPGATPPAEAEAEPTRQVVTSAPDEQLTVIADTDPVALAVSASRALFDESDVLVLVADDDRAGLLLGASAAVALGVPLLVEGPDTGPVDDELERLGAGTVLAVGEAEAPDGPTVVRVPADAEAVGTATGVDLADGDPVADGDGPAAVALLDAETPTALVPADGAAPAEATDDQTADGSGDDDTVPEVTRAEPLTDTVVLATGEPESVAGIATARAAGASVVLTGGATDPRAGAETVDALSEAGAVVVLGAAFAEEDGLDWKVATAASGEQLPGGGQLLFPGRLLVALYGHPGTGALGVLGEQPVDAAIERARAHAAPYEALVDVEVVPAFEIIATVASSAAGPDGNYSNEADVEMLRPWVEAAGEAGLYVFLDLQPGRTDFVTQAELYRSLLELPHVGLALDPEWRLGPNEVHLVRVGSVDVEEVNRVVTWLADLTRENALPQKLLVLHQFRVDMLPGLERLDMTRDELAIMIHADGQGPQGSKQATWRTLHDNAPPSLAWGWKNFYDEDLPMLTPEQTIAQVSPRPELVTYQ